MRIALSLLVIFTTARAIAGPWGGPRFGGTALVLEHGGVWVVGKDICDGSDAAIWYGPGTKPSATPHVDHEDDAIRATVPAQQRDSILALTTFEDTTYAVGRGGRIAVTFDGGKRWSVQRSGTTADLVAVWASSPRDAFAGGYQTLLATHDSGKSWHRISAERADYISIWGAGHDVYAVGTDAIVSRDDGKTWQPLAFSGGGGHIWVEGVSDEDVYVLGRELLRSTDHGTTWARVAPAEDTPLSAMCRSTGPGGFGRLDCCPRELPR